MLNQTFTDDGRRAWLLAGGIVLLGTGLLVDVRLVEAVIAQDGVLASPGFRTAVLTMEIGLILVGAWMLGRAGVPKALAIGGVLAAGSILYAVVLEPTPQRVLDCRAGEGRCYDRFIRHYYGTPECWQSNPMECRPIRAGLQEISFVTDPTNFVQGPFTAEPPAVEYLDVDLEDPWDIAFLPDGSLLVTEMGGRVVLVEPERNRPVLQLEPLVSWGAGLLGVAVDPDFETNGSVYLHYWFDLDDSDPAFSDLDPWVSRILGRVARFVLEGDSLRYDRVILDSIPGSPMHAGGRLDVGPDGKLYLTTGDAHVEELSQDPHSLAGKILRFETDGTIPDDNPIPGSYAFSIGHRNPQGLAWLPQTGVLYAAEHGPDRMDEVNRIIPGGNYGWPVYACGERTPWDVPGVTEAAVTRPLKCFDLYTMAPSGLTVVQDPDSPWYGDLFLAGLRGKHVRRFRIADGEIREEEIFFVSEGGNRRGFSDHQRQISHRLRHVAAHGPHLYVLGSEFGLVRLSPAGAPE